MKHCSKCNADKPLSEFNKKKAAIDGLNCQCRTCENKASKSHYEKNKHYYKEKARRNVETIKLWFDDYKSKLKCEICGEKHPATFDFHHTDPTQKEECISILVGRGSMRRLQSELKKCKVFCANCHRKFHWDEKTV
jgi:hypothetical protein